MHVSYLLSYWKKDVLIIINYLKLFHRLNNIHKITNFINKGNSPLYIPIFIKELIQYN